MGVCGSARVRPLDRAGPDALSFAVSARYAAELGQLQGGCGAGAGGAGRPEPGPRTRIVVPDPYGALVRVLHALFPAESPAARHRPDRPHRRRDRHWAPTCRSARSWCWAGTCGSAPAAGWRRVSRWGTAWRWGTTRSSGPGSVCYRRQPHRQPGGAEGGRRHRRRWVRLSLRRASGHTRIPHVGGCILEDEVEVGSNTCIDRGSIDDTVVGRGTKLDNLVQVGHNVRIGERCLIMAGVGIAGSTRIGNDVILAGHVGRHRSPGRSATAPGSPPRAPSSATSPPAPRSAAIPARAAPAVPAGPGGHVPAGAHRGRAGAAGAGARPAMARRTLARSACVSGHRPAHRHRRLGRVPGGAIGAGDRVPANRPARRPGDSRPPERGAVHRAPDRAGPGRDGGADGRARARRRGGAPDRRSHHRPRRPRAADRRRVVRAVPERAGAGRHHGAAGRAGGLPGDRGRPS